MGFDGDTKGWVEYDSDPSECDTLAENWAAYEHSDEYGIIEAAQADADALIEKLDKLTPPSVMAHDFDVRRAFGRANKTVDGMFRVVIDHGTHDPVDELDPGAIAPARRAYAYAAIVIDRKVSLMDRAVLLARLNAPSLDAEVRVASLHRPRRPERAHAPGQLVVSSPACAHAPPAMTIAPLNGLSMGQMAASPASV